MSKNTLMDGLLINEEALEEVFHHYFDELCHFLGYYTRDVQLVEDCLQDVFVKLWEDRDQIHIFHVKTYLYRAARNRVLNALRNESARTAHLERWFKEEMTRQEAEECINMEEFSLVYQEAIGKLPEKCKIVYQYCKEEQKTYQQAAQELQISIKTVENQMSIASKKIRAHILERYQILYPDSILLVLTMCGAGLSTLV
ncbi:RNA polymerase sigma-70 factor [Sphingobacterium detergens]|uniref:RNA polymerase sigma-70 factor n=1 Tax=Sphingobacterium detergens TaxID=1145106 RepID=UPI003AB030E8